MPEIVLECKPDEALVKALGYSRKMVTHQPNKGAVINYLDKNPGVIGIVDEDPGAANPNYMSKFQKETEDRFDIEYLSMRKEKTRLIVLKPRLEEWILKYAKKSNIKLPKYALPETGHKLHKIVNNRLPRFKDMIGEMLEKDNEALLYLKRLLEKG